MSASLVGSEMCIRDSVCARALCAYCRSCSHYHLRSSTGVQREEGSFIATVSYTHLTLPTICSV
eukprot:5306917-Alexandrium_andersonii.AAC.1